MSETDTPGIPPFAVRIKTAREKAGLTQHELATQIKRSQQTVDGYEHGREPNIAVYREIASATNVDVAWLIFGDQPGGDDGLATILAKAQEQSRYFAWTFHQAAAFLAQEGVNADFAYTLAYAQKLLRAIDDDADEAGTKEAILRTIELDRDELRRELDQARKKLL